MAPPVRTVCGIVVLISSVIVSPAAADTLRPDAILCEAEAPLSLLSEKHLANQPGSIVMKRVSATVQYYELSAKMNQGLLDLANRERDIWRDTRTPSRGNTASRAEEARDKLRQDGEEARRYGEFASRCTATPPQEQPAAVIERRPISGVVRVKTQLRGAEYDLWTHESYIKAP